MLSPTLGKETSSQPATPASLRIDKSTGLKDTASRQRDAIDLLGFLGQVHARVSLVREQILGCHGPVPTGAQPA